MNGHLRIRGKLYQGATREQGVNVWVCGPMKDLETFVFDQ